MKKGKNTKKRILLLIITVISIFNNVKYVNAAYGGGSPGGVGGEGTGSCPPGGPGPLSCPGDGWTATCSASSSSYESSYVYPQIWNMDGKYLGESIDLESLYKSNGLEGVLAGTYIGLNLYEEKYTKIRVDIRSTGIQEYHVCTYTQSYNCGNYTRDYNGNIVWIDRTCTRTDTIEQAGTADNACPSRSGWNLSVGPAYYECTSTCESALAACKRRNEPTLPPLYPSYTGVFPDSNDIDAEPMDPLIPEVTYDNEESDDGRWYWEKSRTKRFAFKLGKACINAKTGEVRYVGENDNCKISDDEYIINENSEFWKYFIPLNANSANDISIILKPIEGSGKVSEGICKSIISNHPDEYMNLIIPARGAFTGNKNRDKNLVSSGCYWAITITIPVIQRFYNELENGINFKGFNFYYKPIDIDNPFPNGINSVSLWNDWNKETKKEPDISKSYDEVTYYANTSGNEVQIRNYNKNSDNPYASWDKMNVNGTSQFIKKEGIVSSNVNLESFYPLGCGPWNENQYNENGSKNYFYQPECDRK